ncbi:MAG: ABC transporter ATP-binding protein [bacterium]
MLTIDQLQVSYGIIPVLHNVSLTVNSGEVVTILGSNGAGKTSLLNAISGVLKPRAGAIRFEDQPITGLSPHKIVARGIAQIPEGRKIFPFMTVLENLFMGACLPRIWPGRLKILEKVYTLFPILKERSNQRASLMSGGEQQMLVIARGLMAQPKLLLIDEPSLGLSPVMMRHIYDVIGTFPRDGVTILLSEQNVQSALKVANRGYVMQDGHIVLEDTADRLLRSELVKKAYVGG